MDLGPSTSSGGSGGSAGTGGAPPPGSSTPECASWSNVGSQLRASVADSNGMAAATRAREQITLGFAPAPSSVRQEDFFNYYRIDLPSQAVNGPIVRIELQQRDIPNQYELFVGVQAPKLDVHAHQALTILVDTTPSMAGVAIERAHFVLQALGQRLASGDVVSILTTNAAQGSASFIVTDPAADLAKAESFLSVSDTGDFGEALGRALSLAQQQYQADAQNRVLLLSDGAEPDSVLDSVPIANAASNGIFISAASTAPGTVYYDRLLAKATQLGRGGYVHVDSASEAQQMFVDRYDEVMGTAIEDVRLQLDLPWFLQLMEEPDTQGNAATSADPQPVAPGATMVFLFKLQTCSASYAAQAYDSITAQMLYKNPGSLDDQSLTAYGTVATLLSTPSPELAKAVAIRSYVSALRSMNKARIDAAIVSAGNAATQNPNDGALSEIDGLLHLHPVYGGAN
jgi:hypothetical protein